MKPEKKKITKRMIQAFVCFVAIWMILDFGYSLFAAWKLSRWEQSIQRNENGVIAGGEAFSVGEGSTGVLLLHGINDTPDSYKRMADVLADQFRVKAIRMPGFGETVANYASHGAEDWLQVVADEIAEMRESHERVFLVAHSLGGAVTIQLLIRACHEGTEQRELLDGVILLAPAIAVSNRRSPILPTRWWHTLSGGLIFTEYTYSPFAPDVLDPEIADFPSRTPFTPRSVINETFRLIDSNQGYEQQITVPVLLVLSEEDLVNDHQASEQWFKTSPQSERNCFGTIEPDTSYSMT